MIEPDFALCVTDTAESDHFDRFFEGYEEAFTLPDEMEDRAGFAECLALNHGPEHGRLAGLFGPFRELCVVASDRASGEIVGGANFIALAPEPGLRGAPVTANLNYIYISPQQRGRGALRVFIAALARLIGSLFDQATTGPVAIFIEQNDPFRMTREAYYRDSEHSGMDQFDRLRIWTRMAARVVDFPYVQPPLSDDQAADETLIYSVMGVDQPSIAPEVVRRHLAGFFGISVLKGKPLADSPEAAAQLARLDEMIARRQQVPLLDPTALLASVHDPLALLDRAGRPQDFRSAIRA